MQEKETNKATVRSDIENKSPYEAPAIIYEGTISTRAGSPVNNPQDGTNSGIDLFGE